jgi:hypothetical protein
MSEDMAPEKGECRNEDFTVLGEVFTDARQLAIPPGVEPGSSSFGRLGAIHGRDYPERVMQGTIPPEAI